MKSQVAVLILVFSLVSPAIASENNNSTGNPDRREGNERLEKQGDKTGNPDRREGNQRQDKCPVAQRGCSSAKISKEDNTCKVDPRKCGGRTLDGSQTTKQVKTTFNPPANPAPRTTAGGSSRTGK